MEDSIQGLLLKEEVRLRNHRVFKSHWDSAKIFVVSGVLGTELGSAARADAFWLESQPGDCLIAARRLSDPGLVLVRSGRHNVLDCRSD